MSSTIVFNISEEISVPPDGTLSRTVHRDNAVKVVLFGFAAGQELSEHTAAVPAMMHVLEGEAGVIIAGQLYEAKAGAWFYMPAHTPHTVLAKTPVKMLLTLVTAAAQKAEV